MIKGFAKTVSFIQFLTGKTQEEIAKSIGYSRPYFSQLMQRPEDESKEIRGLLWEKYKPEIDEFFGSGLSLLEEPGEEYGRAVKIVDAEELLVHDSLIIKGMLRVLLKGQAELLAVQRGSSVKKVLAQMTKAVRDETAAEFDEL